MAENTTPSQPSIVVNTGQPEKKFNKFNILVYVLLIAALSFGGYKQWFDKKARGLVQLGGPNPVQIDVSKFDNFGACYTTGIKKCPCASEVAKQCSKVAQPDEDK